LVRGGKQVFPLRNSNADVFFRDVVPHHVDKSQESRVARVS
jgi:hypothetical protein